MSGCSMGSPPVSSKLKVPSSLSRSMRARSTSAGTGGDVSSNSLQYPQLKLQRRITTSCAKNGEKRNRSSMSIAMAGAEDISVFLEALPHADGGVLFEAKGGVKRLHIGVFSPNLQVDFGTTDQA